MNNKFKTNSRFSALAEETDLTNVFNKKDKNKRNNQTKNNTIESKNNQTNTNKMDKIDKMDNIETKKEANCFTSNGFNSFNSDNNYRRPVHRDFESTKNKELREKQEKEKQEQAIKIRENEKQKLLAIENFPDLLGKNNNKKSVDNKTEILQKSFIDKVKIVKPVIECNSKENYIKPGWIEIKQDPKTRKILTTSNPISKYSYEEDNNEIDVLNSLVALHEKRTQEYIDLWGYDMWEKMFTFPNYDYEYFDKLDEQYQEEMEIFEDENLENDDNYYSN